MKWLHRIFKKFLEQKWNMEHAWNKYFPKL